VAHPWLGRVEVNAFDSLTAGKELPLYVKRNVSRHSGGRKCFLRYILP